MTPIDIAGLVSFVISMIAIPPILLVLLSHSLPRRITGITSSQRLTAASFSILGCTLLFAGQSVLDARSRNGTGSMACAVDALLETYFKTAILAHLAVLAVVNLTSIAVPSRPEGGSFSPSRQAVLILLAYVYALFPLIPTLTTAASYNFRLTEGFGKWWGIYCIDRASWWRIVRPVTLLPPLFLTVVLSVMSISSLYQSSDHPSIKIRPTRQTWLLTFYLLLLALGAISYVIVEQVIGWVWDWWPRIFESLLCLMVLLPYASNRYVWRPYGFWFRLKRCPPPPSEEILPLSAMIGPPQRLISKDSDSDISAKNHLSTTSSFYAYPTPIHDLHKPSLYPLDTILESDTYSPRREVPGRNGPGLQVRFQSDSDHIPSDNPRDSRPDSPPFVYSVADTLNTTRTAPQSAEILASPARTYQQNTSPSSFYSHVTRSSQAGRQAPPPLRIIGASPIATLVSDDMSVYSRSSVDSESQSGVTSVFATRHSKGSSLPQFTPSLRMDMNGRDSVGGDVVFAGARVAPSPPRQAPESPLQRPRFGWLNNRSTPGTPETMETIGTAGTGESAGTFGRRLRGRGGKI